MTFPSQCRSERTLNLKVALHSLTEGFEKRSRLGCHQVKEKQQIFPGDSDLFSDTVQYLCCRQIMKTSKIFPIFCFLFTVPLSPSLYQVLLRKEPAFRAMLHLEETRVLCRQANPEGKTEADNLESEERSAEAASLFRAGYDDTAGSEDRVTSGICWKIVYIYKLF